MKHIAGFGQLGICDSTVTLPSVNKVKPVLFSGNAIVDAEATVDKTNTAEANRVFIFIPSRAFGTTYFC